MCFKAATNNKKYQTKCNKKKANKQEQQEKREKFVI